MNPELLAALRGEADRSWVEHAACRGSDPSVFFIGRGEDAEPARRICRACPVQAECVEYAFETHETHGIWGGLSERQRRSRRKTHREQAA